MFGSQALEIGVGLILVFLLVSLILTAVRESIESFSHSRARDLEHALAELLDDRDGTGLRKQLYNHPLIFSLFPGDARLSAFDAAGKRVKPQQDSAASAAAPAPAESASTLRSARALPSYIPRELFSSALEDLLSSGNVSGRVQDAYSTLLRVGGGDVEAARKGLEQWYDAAMDRASGWYRRRSQKIVGILGVILAVLLNVNAVAIGQYLATNDVAREQVLKVAGAIDAAGLPADPGEQARILDARVRTIGLPIGWDSVQVARLGDRFKGDFVADVGAVLLLIAGYLIVGLAATLGAPFWFDVLGKIMVIRSTVKPTEKSPDEKSKDGGTGGAPKPRRDPEPATGAGVSGAQAAGPGAPLPDRTGEGDEVVEFG